jgi:hypothetical protein
MSSPAQAPHIGGRGGLFRTDRSARLVVLVFVAAEVAMFVTVLVVARHQWFTALRGRLSSMALRREATARDALIRSSME